MRIDQSPVFRKPFVPWYDSDAACIILALAMAVVVLFGFEGVRVARSIGEYHFYVWLPVLLVIGGLFVGVSCVTRLIRRYAGRI